MTVRMIPELAPEAFHAVAEELGLADDLLMDAEVVFVEEAKADMARAQSILDRIENGHDEAFGFTDAETYVRDWARDIMVKVLFRLETRPHDQFHALSA